MSEPGLDALRRVRARGAGCHDEACGAPRRAEVALRPLLLTLLLLIPLAARVRAETVSVDATATVAPPVLPGPKAGGRELAQIFDGDAVTATREEIERELADLSAFRELLPEGGEYRLEVVIERVTRDFRDVHEDGQTPSILTLAMTGRAAWFRGSEVVHETALDISRKLDMDGAPRRRDLQRAYRDIFREAAQRAFGDMYEARFFKPLGAGGGGR